VLRTHTNKLSRLGSALTVMVGVLLLLVGSIGGWGQFEAEPETGILKLDQPGGLMQLWVEAPELLSWDDGDTTVYWQRPASHFYLITSPMAPWGGNPTEVGDEYRAILSYPYATINGLDHFSSGIQFSIDQTNSEIEGQYVDISDLMAAAATADSQAGVEDFWPIPLSMGVREISGAARLPVNSSVEEEEEEGEEDPGSSPLCVGL